MGGIIKSLGVVLAGILLLVFVFALFLSRNTFTIRDLSDASTPTPVGERSETIAPVPAEDRVVLVAVGDIMLSRAVEQQMIAKGDWQYPFLETADLTSGADIAFGNLETTILPGSIVRSGSFLFRTDPKATAGLLRAGFDVLSLANNHMLNFGRNGLSQTLQNLDDAGIGHAGAGLTDADLSAPVIREVKGTKVGFLAYSYAREESNDAAGETFGTAYMDTNKMKLQVAELQTSVDVVVVSMHAGDEYEIAPDAAQQRFARAAIDAGADLVIGHHPHVVETFEKYQQGYIIYSLGNFVFDQMWSEETRLGAMARITIENKQIADIQFVPVKIFDYAQPRKLEGEQAEMILKRLEMKED